MYIYSYLSPPPNGVVGLHPLLIVSETSPLIKAIDYFQLIIDLIYSITCCPCSAVPSERHKYIVFC